MRRETVLSRCSLDTPIKVLLHWSLSIARHLGGFVVVLKLFLQRKEIIKTCLSVCLSVERIATICAKNTLSFNYKL